MIVELWGTHLRNRADLNLLHTVVHLKACRSCRTQNSTHHHNTQTYGDTEIRTQWKGTNYIGLTISGINWNCTRGHSIPASPYHAPTWSIGIMVHAVSAGTRKWNYSTMYKRMRNDDRLHTQRTQIPPSTYYPRVSTYIIMLHIAICTHRYVH